MPALAAPLSTRPPRQPARASEKPICAICCNQMVAAEASAFSSAETISYLWSCDNCGYGFVTQHASATPNR